MFNILVLEDDLDQYAAYEQALEDDGLDTTYTLMHAESLESAKVIIDENLIHAAILDLQIPQTDNATAGISNGLDYLKALLKEKQFPIVVVSANSSSLSNDDVGIPRHLKIEDKRSGVHSDVFGHFESIKSLLEITPLIPETIEDILPEIQSSFWELWGHWTDLNVRFDSQDRNKTKTFLKRYVCSYLIEKWMANDLFKKMHHTEFYTYPPVKDRIHTGDIISYEDDYWIVVTAPCDLSNGDTKYPDNLTILKCEQEDVNNDKYKKLVKPFRSSQNDLSAQGCKINDAAKLFTKQEIEFHYLPSWGNSISPVKVMFKQIKTIPFDIESRANIKDRRVASLSYHFLPYLLQRYGSYVSRIGQADISGEDYIHYLLSVVPE
jgi:CheY-like chemotaxis protein